MPNFAGVLKDEIRRLARKEVKAELAATKKASVQHRSDIATLKRQLRDQARQITALSRASKTSGTEIADSTATTARFSPGWLQAHREKLAISAGDYAALMGVSAQTVYNWEKGKTRPQAKQLEAWSAIRKLGKREAWKLLDEME